MTTYDVTFTFRDPPEVTYRVDASCKPDAKRIAYRLCEYEDGRLRTELPKRLIAKKVKQ